MRLPKFRYAISAGAFLGFVIPLVVTALSWLHIFSFHERLLLFIWPSSIMLMATETLDANRQAFAILAWSIAWNNAEQLQAACAGIFAMIASCCLPPLKPEQMATVYAPG